MMLRKIALLVCTIICVFFFGSPLFGQSTTFKTGTAIIDMGSATPTVKNSLKPYGLVYALLKNNHVTVNWIINSSKVKEGIDFAHNGKTYKGGTFVISADYITSDVTTVLNAWANQGVLIDYTVSDITLDVSYKLNFVPNWVMDKTNGSIGVGFLNAAGIPSSAYTFKNAAQLGSCDDLFVLPHADPTWANHGNLLAWNANHKGAIWAGCHAVSELENLWDGVNPATKMNFLSTNGLLPFTSHSTTSTPFTNFLPGDPMAQFIGKTDNAQLSGSETVYLPKTGSAWRAGAKILTTSPSQSDLPNLDPGTKAVENIYGRAFDNAANGYVAYQASHNIGGTNADQVAAQRMFFNFSFFSLYDKVPPILNISLGGQPTQIKSAALSGQTTGVISATNIGDPGTVVTGYKWTVSPATAGTLNTPTSSTTTFTAAAGITSLTKVTITCVVTAACGRVSFDSKSFTIIPDPGGYPTPATINKSIPVDCAGGSITFNIFDSNIDANAGTRTMVSLTALANGTTISSTDGSITFTSDGTKGTTSAQYKISNDGGTTESGTGTINITVGDNTLVPVAFADAATALVNSPKQIEVLANDKSTASALNGDLLYIRDITRKPNAAKGVVYISPDGRSVTYLSKSGVSGVDDFDYLACNTSGYCATGTVNITLQDNCNNNVSGSGGFRYQQVQTLVPLVTSFVATGDTHLDAAPANQSTSYGSSNPIQIRSSGGGVPFIRPLLSFSTLNTTLPSTSVIYNATLSITASAAFTHNGTAGLDLFPLSVQTLLKPFTEGTATHLTTDGTTTWSTAGAGGSGTDVSATTAGTFPYVTGTINSGDEISATVTSAVQGWVLTPSTNYGFRMNPPTGRNTPNFTFHNREGGSTTAPRLLVSYYPCLTRPTNFAPIVYPDAVVTSAALSLTISPLANDVNYYGNTNLITLLNGSAVATVNTISGTASITNGGTQIVYTPTKSFVGTDTLTYTVADQTNTITSTGTIRITVSRPAPAPVNDVATVNSGTLTSINVGVNDIDYGGTGAPIIIKAPSNGIAVVNGNNIDYTPSAGFTGTDNLTYRKIGVAADACSAALSATATVTITVNNQSPVAGPATLNTFACVSGSVKILDIASDPEGGVLSAAIATGPSHGTVVAKADGTLFYTPTNGYNGADAFTYTVTDPLNATSAAATVTISVSGAPNLNTQPVAVNDADNTLANQPVYTNVRSNDTDPNNDPFTVSLPTLITANGTLTLMANQLVKYTPNANFTGTDTYQYLITDAHGGCTASGPLTATATVTISVTAVPTTLSGTVWTDADQSASPGGTPSFTNIKTNTETGTNGNGTVYIYVVDNSNKIIDRTPVDADGTYLLSNVPSVMPNLKLVMSAEDLALGVTLTTGSLPSGYNNSTPLSRNLPTTTLADMGPFDWGIFTNPQLIPGVIAGGGALCGATAIPATITATSNASGGSVTATGYLYQWQSSTTSASSGFTDIGGATSTTYSPTAITTNTWYRRKASTNLDAVVFSNAVAFTLTANPTVGILPATATIVNGGNILLTADGADSYEWLPVTSLSAANTASVTASPLNTTMYTVTGTITPSGCAGTASITVTVINPGTIGGNQNNCGSYIPASLTSVSDASGATGITYQWQSSTTSATSGFTNIASATNSTYTAGAAISATRYYRRVATGGGSSFNSNVITATVNTIPVVNIAPTSVTISAGLTQTLTASGATTYSWSPSTGLSASNTASVIASPSATTTYTVTGRITATGCTSTGSVIVTVVASGTLIPGIIGSNQTICATATAGAFTSTAASGGTGTISYQWQQSTDNVSFSNISGALSATYSAPSLTQTTYYRRGASTSLNAVVYTSSVKVTVLEKPVIVGGINGPCGITKDSTRTYSVTGVAAATHYVWTLPNGWTGSSTTNTISVKAGATSGTISVTPYNGGCAGDAVTFQAIIIDFAKVAITGVPVTASGNKTNSITVTITLYDADGNQVPCSGGIATLCSNTAGAIFTPVIDNGNGTYTSSLTSPANDIDICGTVSGVPIDKKVKVTFTGPQGGIKSNGPILATETPAITFTATAGVAPFTVIYRSDKSNKNDTLTNVISGVAKNVALIPSTTLYTLVSVIDANNERRDNNFIRDTTTTRVLAPKVIITLNATPAKQEKDSSWATRILVKTKNIGDLDLTSSQARLDLGTVFPNPVTFVLDSVTYSGTTIVPNRNYDGIRNNDLFAKLNKHKSNLFASASLPELTASNNSADNLAPDGSVSMELWQNRNNERKTENDGFEIVEDGHSIYMFGALSSLPIGVEADMVLYLHVKPNGYSEPFVMQAVALGTASTEGATALATSLSNDNNDIATHPEVTKRGEPLPAVINLFPNAVVGASLSAGAPVLQGDGTYNVLLSYKIKNYGTVNLTSLNLYQNLLTSIGSPAAFTVAAVTTTGTLLPNPAFDGKLDSNLLAANSVLGYKQEALLQYTVNIKPNQLSAVYQLRARATAFSVDLGTTVTDQSTNGTDPDTDGNGIPSEKIITEIIINTPVPPLVPGNIGIKTGPTTTVPKKSFCGPTSSVVIVPTSSNSGGLNAYEYQWQSSVDSISFYDIAGAAADTFVTGQVNSSVYLRRGTISGSQVKYSNVVYIQVFPVTKPTITAGGSLILPQTGGVTLTSSLLNNYLWSNAATTRTISVTAAGVYTVTTTDANGCSAVSDSVKVYAAPSIGIQTGPSTTVPAKSYCGPTSGVVIIPTTTGNAPDAYQWQSSTDNISFVDITGAVVASYTSAQVNSSFYLRRKTTIGSQVGYSNSVYIQIFPLTKPTITASGPLVLTQNGNITLTASAANNYLWSTTATTNLIVVSIAGTYAVTTTDANGCSATSDPVKIAPPPPVTVNATYIIGATANPVNSGVQVTGLPAAVLNYYILSTGGTLIPVPVLPSVIGVYTYYVSQTVNGMESVLVPYTVTMLDPGKVADVQKLLRKAPALQSDGSYLTGFTIYATNLRNELLDSVKIKDDLTKVFPGSVQFEVVDIKASGKLIANPLYNGNSQIELLNNVSQLPGLKTDSVELMLKVIPNGFAGTLNNTAIQTVRSPYGSFSTTSNDPVAGNGFVVRNPTKFIIPLVDIFIPTGISPNHDGVNDKFVITHPFNTTINLELTNRWGNLVYKSTDYKNEFEGKGNQANRLMGEDLPDGTYYYIVLATDKTTGSVRKFGGFITLKR